MNDCSVPDELVVYGSMFTTSITYVNPALTYRYSLEMRGLGTLRRTVEWDYIDPATAIGFVVNLGSTWSVDPGDIFIVKPY